MLLLLGQGGKTHGLQAARPKQKPVRTRQTHKIPIPKWRRVASRHLISGIPERPD